MKENHLWEKNNLKKIKIINWKNHARGENGCNEFIYNMKKKMRWISSCISHDFTYLNSLIIDFFFYVDDYNDFYILKNIFLIYQN